MDLAINPEHRGAGVSRAGDPRKCLRRSRRTGNAFITDKKIAEKNEMEHQRRVAQLAGELLAKAGADGITLQELDRLFQ